MGRPTTEQSAQLESIEDDMAACADISQAVAVLALRLRNPADVGELRRINSAVQRIHQRAVARRADWAGAPQQGG
jgi:hypothetical protein